MRIVSYSSAIILAVLSLTGSAVAAPVETVLYSFQGGSDGATPFAGLIANDSGALYGTTLQGGNGGTCIYFSVDGCGTVFKLTPPAKGQTAWTEAVLYSFKGGSSDGAIPYVGLIADNQGALYGTTLEGGSCPPNPSGCGTVFKLTPPAKGQTAWTETVLYSFCSRPNCSDGREPEAGLIADNQGALYGTTASGGSGGGTVFKLTPPAKGQTAWIETVLYSFKGGSNGDGAGPVGSLIADKQGALYGTTFGSVNPNLGIVFKLTPPAKGQTAWTETVLCTLFGNSFTGLIADNQGALYGTTFQGPGAGGIFKLTPPAKGQTAWTEAELYTFTGGSDGAVPYGGLIAEQQGALYGTTEQGGIGANGTVFKLTPPAKGQTAWTETVLYNFKGGSSDGANPTAGLIADEKGALYSTTSSGGSSKNEGFGYGTVFKLTLSP
jgi:uncharacterized repeat protein (TIGR03803 family)